LKYGTKFAGGQKKPKIARERRHGAYNMARYEPPAKGLPFPPQNQRAIAGFPAMARQDSQTAPRA